MKKYIIYIDDGLYDFAEVEVDGVDGEEEHIFYAETYTEAEIYFFRWMIENGH